MNHISFQETIFVYIHIQPILEALFYAHLVSIICHYMKRVIKFNIYQCYIHVGNKFIDEGIPYNLLGDTIKAPQIINKMP